MAIDVEDADEMWLRRSVMAGRAAHQTFCVNVDATGEDAISLRLRSEIAVWLGASLVSDPSQATVILRTLTSSQAARLGLVFTGAAADEGWHIRRATADHPVIIESLSTIPMMKDFSNICGQ